MARIDRDRIRRAAGSLLFPAFVAILAIPHLPRIRHPSLYSDDVQRVVDLQTNPLHSLWFRPFNQHMAPFFETISWLAWRAAGRDLTRAPMAFTLASYVPFVLCLGLLARWLRRETGSTATALAATALFGLSPIYAETVFWYSASSFTWALFWTMVVLLSAGSTGRAARLGSLIGSLLAPASSAIGLLAGPLGTLRLMAGRRQLRRDWLAIGLPAMGTLLYLASCSAFRYHRVIRSGIDPDTDFVGGILLALRAPTARLIPGTFGLADVDLWLPPGLNLALTGLGLIAIVAWGVRSPHRGPIAAALGLILGGYALTYPFRNQHGPHWLLQTGRFHLFPQLGLVALIALGGSRWLGCFDRQPRGGLVASTGLAALLLATQIGRFRDQERNYRFPEQPRTLATLERLGALCRSRNVTREQCIDALDPAWNHWFQPEYNGLWMVPAPARVSGRADPDVRKSLLEQLTAAERKAIWGGMDVSRHLSPVENLAGVSPDGLAVGRLVETDHAHSDPSPLGARMRRYTMTGWPAYLEFELTPPDPSKGVGPGVPRYLGLPCGPSPEPLELWWAKRGERWSPSRCVRFRPDPRQPPREWALPLDRIPHWNPDDAERIRVRFVAAPVAIGEPRLLR